MFNNKIVSIYIGIFRYLFHEIKFLFRNNFFFQIFTIEKKIYFMKEIITFEIKNYLIKKIFTFEIIFFFMKINLNFEMNC